MKKAITLGGLAIVAVASATATTIVSASEVSALSPSHTRLAPRGGRTAGCYTIVRIVNGMTRRYLMCH